MVIFFLILFIILVVYTTHIKIQIIEFQSKIQKYKLIRFYKYKVKLYLFGKIKYASITLTKDKINKTKNNKLVKKVLKKQNINIKKTLELFIKSKKDALGTENILKIESLNLILKIGTEFPTFTTFSTAILAILISNVLARTVQEFKKEKYYYKIMPYYLDKNFYDLSINCIISLKLAHIIKVIVLMKKRSDRNGRASNRRTHDDSYGQYPRYGRC